jgi:CelD/BcsL family acetyltransferase involved in cellulose biosynthesis
MLAGSVPDELERLAPEWDALAERVGASPFVRSGWIRSWWRSFGVGKLAILIERRGPALAAVLPTIVRQSIVLSPCNWHSPEFGVLSADDRAAGSLIETLFSRRPQVVSLRPLDSGSAAVEQLHAAASEAHYHPAIRTLASSPCVPIDRGWSEYERGLSRNLKQDVARCRRRLAEHGPVSLEVSRSVGDLQDAFALERLGWKGARGTAMAARPRVRQFYEEIARWAESHDWLRLVFLRAGSRRVAFHLALEYDGVYVPLKGGYDPAVGQCSPGKLIIHSSLERAFESGLRRVVFLAGGDQYKLRWATEATEVVHFQAFAPTVRGAAGRIAEARGRPLASRARNVARAMRAR